jgi:phage gp29-like protein
MIPGMENLGLRWRQIRFNPLRSLTPEKLASALDQHAAGWVREAALIFETIEQREAVVRSVMTKRRAAVARRDWQIMVPDEEHPKAEAHKATLEYFYNNLTVTDATDLNVRTGVSGLLRQMMDAIVQRYAVHEIVWQPGPEGLTAELRRVPLYFFENRSGKLRFIGPESRADGMELEEDGWMVTAADGLGEALSICYMYKRLGIQDLLAFSEKFSIPGVLGRTSAKKDSDEGNAMRDSVLSYASEWVGLVYGDDGSIKDPISVIQTPGGGTSLPPMTIAEYMDRMIAILVRGGDLSTISREGDSSGSNRQQDETDALLEDDCALVSETLQTQLDRLVIRMVHGDETPAAYIVINPPSNQDLKADLEIDEGLARLGLKQDPSDLAERYGREASEIQDDKTQDAREEEAAAAADAGADPDADPDAGAENEAAYFQADALRAALSADLQPLGEALAGAMQAGDVAAMRAALKKISEGLPDLAGEAGALEEALVKQFIQDLTEDENQTEA